MGKQWSVPADDPDLFEAASLSHAMSGRADFYRAAGYGRV